MEKWWKTQSWRLIQTNLSEIDMRDMDAGQYARDLQDFGANIVFFNAAGIIANYHSKLACEAENQYLTGDSADAILEKCHEAGIRVIARTDFSKVVECLYNRHPEWAYRTKDNGIVNYNGYVQVCLNGDYQQKHMYDILGEMLREHAFDGVFFNMGGFHTIDYSYNYYGPCHCESCKRKFRERFNLDLPKVENDDDPVYQKYRVFLRDSRAVHEKKIAAFIRGINPNVAIDCFDFQRCESNTEINRPLPSWQYSASSNTRRCRNEAEGIISSNTSVDFLGYPYRHVAVSPQLQELRLWQDLANLGGLDYYLMGRIDNHRDRSGFDSVKKVFHYARDHEAAYTGLASAAKALVVGKERWIVDAEVRGWIRALTEAHIPFDEILYAKFPTSIEHVKRYDLIVLPDLKYVSDQMAAVLDQFAKEGGVVLATNESAMHDGSFAPRDKVALECLGIEKVLYKQSGVMSAMLEVTERDKPAFTSFTNLSFVAIGDRFIHVEMKKDAKAYLRYIPKHKYGPPECCYYTDTTDIPGAFASDYGKGKGVFIPWKPGEFYYREGHANTLLFMRDVLNNLCGAKSIAPDMTPMVETTLAKGAGRCVVQLVNTTGHYGNSYFTPIPVHNLSIVLGGVKPKKIETLRGGKANFETDDKGAARVTLDVLADYEAIILHI